MGSHRVGHDWSYLACTHALVKEMATHPSILPSRIPGTEELGGLPSVGSYRVGHNLAAAAATSLLLGILTNEITGWMVLLGGSGLQNMMQCFEVVRLEFPGRSRKGFSWAYIWACYLGSQWYTDGTRSCQSKWDEPSNVLGRRREKGEGQT